MVSRMKMKMWVELEEERRTEKSPVNKEKSVESVHITYELMRDFIDPSTLFKRISSIFAIFHFKYKN